MKNATGPTRRPHSSPSFSLATVARNRLTNPTTYARTDTWFHYDQVGSVVLTSNAAGSAAEEVVADAWGNTLDAGNGTTLGLFGGPRAGWRHNTKEYDAQSSMVYMYQRWYLPETGTFASSAPYPPMMEHRFAILASPYQYGSPTADVDVTGELWGPVPAAAPAAGGGLIAKIGLPAIGVGGAVALIVGCSLTSAACDYMTFKYGCKPQSCDLGWCGGTVNAPPCGPPAPVPPVPIPPVPAMPGVPGVPGVIAAPGSQCPLPDGTLDGIYAPNTTDVPGYVDEDGNPIPAKNPYPEIKKKVDDLMRGR